MVKKFFVTTILTVFIFSSLGMYSALAATETENPTAASIESTKDRASRGMNNLLYGPVEAPDNIDESKTKGTAVEGYTPKTRSGVERGIARVGTGIWQLATFWYSDPGCVTKAPASQKSASSQTK